MNCPSIPLYLIIIITVLESNVLCHSSIGSFLKTYFTSFLFIPNILLSNILLNIFSQWSSVMKHLRLHIFLWVYFLKTSLKEPIIICGSYLSYPCSLQINYFLSMNSCPSVPLTLSHTWYSWKLLMTNKSYKSNGDEGTPIFRPFHIWNCYRTPWLKTENVR